MEAGQPELGRRIVVVGTTGSGKTTVARELATLLGVTYVELDALNWEPGWVGLHEHDPEEFRRRVAGAVDGDTWVVDGNYRVVRDLVWPEATAVVWLDYQLWRTLWGLLKRTIHRVFTKEVLWQGNTESFRDQFMSRDSLFLFAIKTRGSRNRNFRDAFAQPEHAHLTVFRHRSPGEARAWLRRIAEGAEVGSGAAG